MRFRKRPVVVEAEQYDGSTEHHRLPPGMCREQSGDCLLTVEWFPHVHTLEGAMRVSKGDWVIRGVAGEFYPCKPDIFALTYEPLKEREKARKAAKRKSRGSPKREECPHKNREMAGGCPDCGDPAL